MSANLEALAERIRESFERKNQIRDEALAQSRNLTRHSARAIRAIHRNDSDLAHEHLSDADKLANALREGLSNDPDLYFSGYAQERNTSKPISLLRPSWKKTGPQQKICGLNTPPT